MSSDNIAIRVKNLGKKYTLGGPQEQYLTLRDAIVNSVKAPFKRFNRTTPDEGFWALKDVSFEVEQGEVLGIIGRNGAGKSTLLKLLSRITSPTEGTIEIHGRIGSLLEVGTGFHPEMTGRENIFLNGSILGMRKREIESKLDKIVKFSEVEKFLDTPVKRYSSGMYVRLAFAVAAHMDTEILLIDEVLAVGDAQFQKKCMGKMGDVAKEGRTVLFVSHNMAAMKTLCHRGIVLDEGRVRYDGEASEAVDLYFNQVSKVISEIPLAERRRDKSVSLRAKILDMEITSEGSGGQEYLDSTKPWTIRLKIQVFKRMNISCQIQIKNMNRNILLFSSEYQQNKIFECNVGTYEITCSICPPFLTSGDYWITCGLLHGKNEWVDYIIDAYKFSVQDLDIYHNGFNLTQTHAIYHVDHFWNIQ